MDRVSRVTNVSGRVFDVHGFCAVKFAPLRAAFQAHFTEHDEVGASLGVTFFGLGLTPVFYVLLRALEKRVTGTAEVHHHVTV